jgi:tRNA-specific 2-thiouridylase
MKIAVAMSGGVDSSVAAYLLKKEGHDVFGIYMKNWEEKTGRGCCAAQKDYEDVVRVCIALNIPYYIVNFTKEYWDRVFTYFLKEVESGFTPNPDILCNREIKFNALLKKALALGADKLATGHYCQLQGDKLLKGQDPNKDQTYFLYTLKKKVFPRLLFPVGGMFKSEVREIAKGAKLPIHDKKDSTGICFIGKRNFKAFLEKYIPHKPGYFKSVDGKILGSHDGAFYYTIGQRKGLRIGGPGEAWFVVHKDMKQNSVIVAQGKNHPALFAPALYATDLSWIGKLPTPLPYICKAKIRYRQRDTDCTIQKVEGDRVHVTFHTPQRAITPRQSIVFYEDGICLGGAIIQAAAAGPSL